jgi:large subunit ribosomal protein L6
MSRIGKKPIGVPDKVEVKIEGLQVTVKGPKGTLSCTLNKCMKVIQDGKTLTLAPDLKAENASSLWGTSRSMVANMVEGVSTGFNRVLEFNGVGYKAAVSGQVLTLNLGYSHPIDYQLPAGITAKVNKNLIELAGSDKELLGFVASKIRSFRPPEPYKGKGVKYVEETIARKAGKSGAKK